MTICIPPCVFVYNAFGPMELVGKERDYLTCSLKTHVMKYKTNTKRQQGS